MALSFFAGIDKDLKILRLEHIMENFQGIYLIIYLTAKYIQ